VECQRQGVEEESECDYEEEEDEGEEDFEGDESESDDYGVDSLDDGSINKWVLGKVDSLRDRLPDGDTVVAASKDMKSTLASRARTAFREIKGQHSSEFECAMIKGTRPDDSPAKEKHVSRLIETIQVFPRTSAYNSDYYFMMLHKLWSRMAEHDWRTVAKSLFIFHRMAVSVDPSLHLEFVQVGQACFTSTRNSPHRQLPTAHCFFRPPLKRFNRMQRLTHKKTKATYYNLETLLTVRDDGAAPFGPGTAKFLRAYAVFCFERFLSFSGRFEELDSLDEGADLRKLLGQLKQARRVLEKSVQLKTSKSLLRHEVVAQCSALAMADCFVAERGRRSLWEVFGERLGALLSAQRTEAERGGRLAPSDIEATSRLVEWAGSFRGERLGKVVVANPRALARLKKTLPADKELEEHGRWLAGLAA